MSEIPRFDCKCGHTAMAHFATSTTPEDGPMKPTWCITCGRDKCAQYEHAGTSQIETRHPLLIRAENAEQASADHLKELEALREQLRRGPCCKEPDSCGGECTCQICAPDLAIRDLEALLADSREENAALEAQLRSKDEQLAGMRDALERIIARVALVSPYYEMARAALSGPSPAQD